MQTDKRLGALDGLRGLAALYVVLGHCLGFVPQTSGSDYNHDYVYLSHGHEAVVLFIVISGYCLALPLMQGKWSGAKDFYRRRVRRILPAYYAAFLFALALVVTRAIPCDVNVPNPHLTTAGIISHLLLMSNLIGIGNLGNSEINGCFWSVALECQIYVVFPLLCWTTAR